MGEDDRATGKNYATKAEIPLHLARLWTVLDVPALIPATVDIPPMPNWVPGDGYLRT